jgi:hypothetical protein
MESRLREEFDKKVVGSRLDQNTLLIVRSFIGALTRDCLAKYEITLQDAHDMVQYRAYEEFIVQELFKPLLDKISTGKYITLSEHDYYRKISKSEYDKIFGV